VHTARIALSVHGAGPGGREHPEPATRRAFNTLPGRYSLRGHFLQFGSDLCNDTLPVTDAGLSE
jgi:hypothetical protein